MKQNVCHKGSAILKISAEFESRSNVVIKHYGAFRVVYLVTCAVVEYQMPFIMIVVSV